MQELLQRLVVVPVENAIMYIVFFPLSIPGVLALIGGLWLGRRDRFLPKLWYLLPISVSELAAVMIPWLAATMTPPRGTLPDSWAAIFALLQLLTIALAVWLNRTRIGAALLLAAFPVTFAIVTVVMMGLDIVCRRGC